MWKRTKAFDEFRRHVDHASASTLKPPHLDKMVRLYCTSSPAAFGADARWNLQVFAPLKRRSVAATASLSPADLLALRDACNEALSEFAAYAKRGKRAGGAS